MNILAYEMKKILWKRKIVWMVLLFLLIKFAYILGGGSPSSTNRLVEEDKIKYMEYMEELNGPITKEKIEYIQKEEKKIKEAEITTDDLIYRYMQGNINMEEYIVTMNQSKDALSHKRLVAYLSQKLDYINKDSNNRYFTYENGWMWLFGNNSYDITLIILLLLILCPIYIQEYTGGMYIINETCKKGERTLFLSKTFSAVAVSVVATILFYTIEVAYAEWKYGLVNAVFPMQSVSILENSPLKLSLYQAVLFVLILKCLGTLSFVFACIFIQICVKRMLPSLFLSLVVLMGPVFILLKHTLYKFPYMINFFMSNGYVRGVLDESMQEWMVFQPKEIVVASIVLMVSSVLLAFAGQFLYMKEKTVLLLLMLFLLSSLTACETNRKEVVIYNGTNGQELVCNQDYVVDLLGVNKSLLYHNENQEKKLIRNPLLDEDELEGITQAFLSESGIYYIQKSGDYNDFAVRFIDLNSFTDRVIYRYHGVESDKKNFMDIGYKTWIPSTPNQTWNEVLLFFVENGKLFLVKNHGVYQVDLQTRREKLLIKGQIHNRCISYDNGIIYYIDDANQLMKYTVEEEKSEKLVKDLAMNIYLYQGALYYTNASDGCSLYCFQLTEDTNKKVVSNSMSSYIIDSGNVYYIDEGGDLYSVGLERDAICKQIDEDVYGVYGAYARDEGKELFVSKVKEDKVELVKILLSN